MLYSKLVQGETRKPRHSDVEQQEEGRRSTMAAIRNRRAEAAAKDGTCRCLGWKGTSCESAAGQRRAASARSRCPGGNGRWGNGASSQASRQSKEGDR